MDDQSTAISMGLAKGVQWTMSQTEGSGDTVYDYQYKFDIQMSQPHHTGEGNIE